MARRRGRWAQQAALEALLRFGPEQAALRELQYAALGNFQRSVRTARGSARAIGQTVQQERPRVGKAYRQSIGQARAGYSIANDELAALGPEANSLKAAAALEREGAVRRLRESRADELSDLSERRVAAQEGRAFAVQQARTTLVDDLTKVLRAKRDLARQRGTFTQLTTRELRQAAQQRAMQERQFRMGLSGQERRSIRSSGIDPNTGKPIPGGRLDPDANNQPGDQRPRGRGGRGGGGNRATRGQIGTAQDIANTALAEARSLARAGLRRSEIASALRRGQDDIERRDPQTGKPIIDDKGRPEVIPGVPQIKSPLILSAALDQVFLGYVRQSTARALNRRGIYVTDLGFTPRRVWRRRVTTGPGAGSHPRT